MKRIFAFISLALAALLLAGCAAQGSGNQSGLFTPVPNPATSKVPISEPVEPIDPGTLISEQPVNPNEAQFWDYLRLGGSADGEGVTYKIFTNYPDFRKEFGDSLDELERRYDDRSFQKGFVIAVYVTTRTGGYTFSLESALVNNSTATVVLNSELAPGQHTQAFETHVVLVGFDSSVYKTDLAVKIEGVGALSWSDKI